MDTVKYDLHIHSCLSPCGDDDMTPANIAGMAMLNGIQIAALTDHNTCKNCPAFFDACGKYGVVPVAGMELTTTEEIHVVCLFDSLETAMDFDGFVEKHRMHVRNRPDIFGQQVIMGTDDKILGYDPDLLILATDFDLSAAADAVRKYGGAAIPAHIDKQANSVIGVLGTIPDTPVFPAVEFHCPEKIDQFRSIYPVLKKTLCIVNSDAHYLEHMSLNPSQLPGFIYSPDEDKMRKNLIFYLQNGYLK